MGDRANIVLEQDTGSELWLYSHWAGSDMPRLLRDALGRGRARWDDEPYLGRIIFCELVQDDWKGLTGLGLTTYETDGGRRVLRVNVKRQEVRCRNQAWPFEEFVRLNDKQCDAVWGGTKNDYAHRRAGPDVPRVRLPREPAPEGNTALRHEAHSGGAPGGRHDQTRAHLRLPEAEAKEEAMTTPIGEALAKHKFTRVGFSCHSFIGNPKLLFRCIACHEPVSAADRDELVEKWREHAAKVVTT